MKTKLFVLILFFYFKAFSQESFASPLDLTYSTPCDPHNDIVTLSFVGDILIHQALYRAVVDQTQHFSQLWKRTDILINKADFSVGNLEGPAALGVNNRGQDVGDIGFIYDGAVYSGTNFVFNYHPRIFADLKNTGFDLLTLANNHSFDRYSLGIDKTITAAQKAGMPTIGTRLSQERNGAFFQIRAVKNMRIAYLGCTEFSNKKTAINDQLLFCYNDEIVNLIKEISSRTDVDALIVMTHWGVEYVSKPDWQQQTFAKRYLDAGATAVVGSHPHVLQPWQKYITKDGRETFIAYSLGNFIAGQAGLARQTGAVVYVGLSKEGHQKAKVLGVGYTPTYRKDLELYPVGKAGVGDVLKYAAQLFGEHNRIEPQAPLLQSLCSKTP